MARLEILPTSIAMKTYLLTLFFVLHLLGVKVSLAHPLFALCALIVLGVHVCVAFGLAAVADNAASVSDSFSPIFVEVC